ncbi:MAG: trigger factor family protein [Candidatus Pacebacteria bacterium]|nr:trigger factor family protein [Candidatus Paceibacterota bacterium]
MKVEIKKLKDAKAEIDFEMDWQEFEVYYQKALDKINQGISLDGFRPGKAPKDVVEQKVGGYKI